jgi:arsenate reductase
MTLDERTVQRLYELSVALSAEYDGVFSRETVERVVADSLEGLGGITVSQHLPVLIERFARDRLRAAARADGLLATDRPVVLFVCAHNAGRSQLAAALTRHVSQGEVEALSAGSDPAPAVDHAVLEAIGELGIAPDYAFPKPLTDDVVRGADVVVTMGCGDPCPVFPGPRYLDWTIPDPSGRDLDAVRKIRAQIADRVLDLLKDLV